MSLRLSICATALLLAVTSPAVSQVPASRWDHNGSEVGLFASGNDRVFRYIVPRVGLTEVGVTPGTVLFVGERSVDTYSGQAYVFSSRCGPQAYFVNGSVSADQRSVTLYGDAPTRYDAWCRAIATRPDTLVFTFIEPPVPSPGIATAPPPPPALPPGIAAAPPPPPPTPPASSPSAASPPISGPAPSPYPSTGTVGDTVGSDRTAEQVTN